MRGLKFDLNELGHNDGIHFYFVKKQGLEVIFPLRFVA